MRVCKKIENTSNQQQNKNFDKMFSFNYLGGTVGQTGKGRINERKMKSNQAYVLNRNTPKDNNICKYTKTHIYKTLIRPTIIYAKKIIMINKKKKKT